MNNSCGGCGSCASGCGGCAPSDGALYLTELELTLLTRFGQTPFFPVGHDLALSAPVCLEWDEPRDAVSDALSGLAAKGLIEIDADLPLSGFSYDAYGACRRLGSMALTARGQQVLELLEIQGIGG